MKYRSGLVESFTKTTDPHNPQGIEFRIRPFFDTPWASDALVDCQGYYDAKPGGESGLSAQFNPREFQKHLMPDVDYSEDPAGRIGRIIRDAFPRVAGVNPKVHILPEGDVVATYTIRPGMGPSHYEIVATEFEVLLRRMFSAVVTKVEKLNKELKAKHR